MNQKVPIPQREPKEQYCNPTLARYSAELLIIGLTIFSHYYQAQLGLTDKGRAINGLVV